MRIKRYGMSAHCQSREPFKLGFASRRCHRFERRMAEDLCIIFVGDNNPAAFGQVGFALQRRSIEFRRHAPVKKVAKVQIVCPFVVAEQISSLHLDFDNHEQAFCIDTHQVSAATILERHFIHAPDAITSKQPLDPACDLACALGVGRIAILSRVLDHSS